MQPFWTYGGKRVFIPSGADIPADFRPGRPYGGLVQEVLNIIAPWQNGDGVHKTRYFDDLLRALIVPINGRPVTWGIHVGHRAKKPSLSPFVSPRRSEFTDAVTVELIGSAAKPQLVRAYPGERTPALPWQVTSGKGRGSRQFSREFWRTHAYVGLHLIKSGTQVDEPPWWFLEE